MKKLMTTIAAATAAFGLYAADPVVALHGASMETDEGYTVGEGVVDVDSYWVTDAEADESVVTEYADGETVPDHLNYDYFWMDQLNYLKVEAEQPLYRAIATPTGTKTENLVPVDIAVDAERDGIIIDQLVKFSAFDAETAPEVEKGAKIAVWVKAGEEDDTKGTLQITTAALNETFEPTTTTIDTEIEVAVADWHQLKITAIEAADIVGDVVPGFTIQIDDKVLDCATELFPAYDDYTAEAKKLIGENKLFPSMVLFGGDGAGTLVGVAYKGTGAIDDVAVANYVADVPVLPTATVTKIDAEGYEVAVQFDAGNIGVGYDNWIAKFGLTSNVDIGQGEVMLGGQYGTYDWIDMPYECSKDEEISVLAAVGLEDNITVREVFEGIQSFKCGVKNVALKNDATFTLRLIIVNEETKEIKEICKIDNLTVKAKAQGWPEEWEDIDADQAVKDKFAAWRAGDGAGADLNTDAAKNAFLLNCSVEDLEGKELTIKSIDVDAEGYAAIEVSIPGDFGFPGIDLAEINGVLHIEAGNALDKMEKRAVAWWFTENGNAISKVKYNFIKAAVGFKKPELDADAIDMTPAAE